MTRLSGWGRFPVTEAKVLRPRDEGAVRDALRNGPVIARGNGRSYGDSAVQARGTLDMRGLNRLLAFDPDTGVVEAEAGVMLGDVIRAFLPRGWFPAVTPGTKLITIGGAVASDVHGKNHRHDGSFGRHVAWIDVMDGEGAVHRCTPRDNSELFRWTLGGMGLTGVILRAGFRLRPVTSGWIAQEMRPAANLVEAMEIFETSDATYSVAWFDCLGRGDRLGRSLVMLAEHAERDQLPSSKRHRPFHVPEKPKRRVPLDAPAVALNRYTLRAFNALYHWNGSRKAGPSLVDWDSYFYPLDALLEWNRIYGRRGFAQFQCVLPLISAREGLTALLDAIAASGQGSFLAVLKRLGVQESAFSFPMEGYTLALDFPVNPASLKLMDRLDAITLEHGGRFYLAKDSRLSGETLRAADPRVADFTAMRAGEGRARAFASGQSERLKI
ncbi:FAD-binding protein [Pseudooceanicola sp. 216_PA32_1]|uniref:FAD-binding protein n=1 Tax=Pseudooceanicola pacificus TaxID=2676438 RepID=A0A844W4Q1_9RHOB|nr:FAD-binding oxidoreductase [Pseudooceanicola pacificus]MWB79226.1 FAD-binding protein [Pseudooceanicola pacificus]